VPQDAVVYGAVGTPGLCVEMQRWARNDGNNTGTARTLVFKCRFEGGVLRLGLQSGCLSSRALPSACLRGQAVLRPGRKVQLQRAAMAHGQRRRLLRAAHRSSQRWPCRPSRSSRRHAGIMYGGLRAGLQVQLASGHLVAVLGGVLL
jgi:hypothetical protein